MGWIRKASGPTWRTFLLGSSGVLLACSLSQAFPFVTQVPLLVPGGASASAVAPTPASTSYLQLADHAFFLGDWTTALTDYQAALSSGAHADQALLGLGHTQLAAGDPQTAQLTLQSLITTQPQSPLLAPAQFLLGEADNDLKDYTGSAKAYEAYLSLKPGVIDSYAQENQGDALAAAGQAGLAAQAYAAAANAPRAESLLPLLEKEADALHQGGSDDQALSLYAQIFKVSTNDYDKARLDLKMGEILVAQGKTQDGFTRYVDAVANYPLSHDSYLALVELVNAGFTVDELQRGLVDYYADQYQPALAALNRYLASSPPLAAKAYYYRGLTYLALNQPDSAIADLQAAIQQGPSSDVWDRAWFELADARSAGKGDTPGAIQTYLQFVAADPTHPRAAEALFDAARLAEESGDLATAASLWKRCGQQYPSSDDGPDCAHLAGISYYRSNDYVSAQAQFTSLANSADASIRSRALFWMGKARAAQGDATGAKTLWTQAAQADPTGYYSDRAQDLLVGRQPFAPLGQYGFGFNLATERAQAEAWVLQRFPQPTPEPSQAIQAALLNDPRVKRGQALWDLGLYSQAEDEFDQLRGDVSKDAVASFYLCNYLLDLGYYPGAIFAARQVLDLAGMSDATTLTAPAYFSHVRFGPYFADLLLPQAQAYSLDPLLLFAVVRQESLFGATASSTSNAYGLMQIIPSTGEQVASKLGLTDFTDADLARAVINVKLGTAYLAEQRDELGGNLYVALAAYNGGPGNAARWEALAPNDPDLFVETVRYAETRTYIKDIYEIYAIYRQLYAGGR
ncbi:MAG: tetratricopeptide repeat protein [Anaerolineales bacterium]|jgi:soluble lytic murein transglycosylase